MAQEKAVKTTKSESAFTKAQLMSAKRYDLNRDALYVVLDDNDTYTHKQVEGLLKQFYKGGKK